MIALRAFSLAFLAWHLGRLFPGLAEPWFLAAAAVAGLFGGTLVRRWRAVLGLPAAVLAVLAAQLVLVWIPSSLPGGPTVLDAVPLWADRQLLFSLPFFALAWFEGWAFTGRRAAERVIHALAAVAVFWSQGPYHVTLYPHPLALALAFGLFLASELLLLSGNPPRRWPQAAALLVIAAGVGFLWSLLGRYEDQSTASGGGLMKPDLFQFDFAPLVRLEDEITLGDNLVLLYREEGTPRPRYLRRMVLTDYNASQGFSIAGKPPVVGRRPQTFPVTAQERVPIRQEYYLVNLDPSSFLALNTPVAVTPYAQWNRSSFVNAYRVDSLVAGDDFWLYNEQMDDGLSAEERALSTRGGDDPEIRELALSVTKGAETPYEKATAIQLYLREHYFYSLKPGAPGSRGALKHFLFEGKKGYCSYFAFSMTLMLRSLGIPSRIAVGFATNPDDAVLGFTPVRAFQAHAWVEVPFGPYGWIEFDPTSDIPAPGEPFRFPKPADSQVLSKLIAEILDAQPQPLSEQAEAARKTSMGENSVSWTSWLVVLPLLLLAANELWRYRWALARSAADHRRVQLHWRQLVFHARRARLGPRPGETPEAWADRAVLSDASQQAALRRLADAVSRARYAAPLPEGLPVSAPEIAALTKRLLQHFDASRPAAHRAAAFLLPWWPL